MISWKWPLFSLLALVAPAPVIAFESFVTGPPVFVLAQTLYMLADLGTPRSVWHPQIIGFFAVHLLMYGLGYFVVAWGLARLARDLGPLMGRVLLTAAGLAVVATAFAPVYGGGGIFNGVRGSLFYFFAVLETTHFGPYAALKIYGPAVVVIAFAGLWRRQTMRRPQPS